VNKRLARFFDSKSFKRITLGLGISFLLLSFFITVRPEPFLKFGYLGVFAFNLFGPGTLLIPTLAKQMNLLALSMATALGMILNDSIGWIIGASGVVIIPRSKKALKAEKILQKHGTYGFFLLSLLPLPYDFIGLIAGYLEVPYQRFFVPSLLGKVFANDFNRTCNHRIESIALN